MATTIQISDSVKIALNQMKVFQRETYNEVIEDMIEDNLELNDKTKKELEEARKRMDAGEFLTHKEVEKELGL
ncbi:hypothetical protein GOV13_00400 [Candidatus Pacearchaeota archaeon]|nr:hypothetical protein [Candidatus Pacearchaeota archaeon]